MRASLTKFTVSHPSLHTHAQCAYGDCGAGLGRLEVPTTLPGRSPNAFRLTGAARGDPGLAGGKLPARPGAVGEARELRPVHFQYQVEGPHALRFAIGAYLPPRQLLRLGPPHCCTRWPRCDAT